MATKSEEFKDLVPVAKPIGWFKPDERNSRKHPPEQIEKLRKAIRRYGVRWPALARKDGKLIVGHGRIEAAKAEGLKKYPALIAPDHWTDEMCREFMIADNQQPLGADWDLEMLRSEIEDLSKIDDADLGALGFDESEIDALLKDWDSDIIARGENDAHTDPIPAMIKIRLAKPEDADSVRASIEALLKEELDVEFEIL